MKVMTQKSLVIIGIGILSFSCNNRSFNNAPQESMNDDSGTLSSPLPEVERPPQHVLLAFDGSYDLKMWDDVINFSHEMSHQNKDLRWTIFLSCVYYLWRENGSRGTGTSWKYHCPDNPKGDPSCSFNKSASDSDGRTSGRACLGNGDSADDVLQRLIKTNSARAAGHEIGSHSCCHCDGYPYSEAQWEQEFSQFERFVLNSAKENDIKIPEKYKELLSKLTKKDITGFRAPLLRYQKSQLWPVLKKHGFKYDTSLPDAAPMQRWPDKIDGIWEFPLAMLPIAGTSKATLSMDYNFYHYDSGASDDAKNSNKYEDRMFDSYMNYFNTNYYGNRAPINIGHHFSKWNNSAYWNALKRFASTVCGMPEVKCSTYNKLVEFMETVPATKKASYQAGRFPKLAKPASLSLGNQWTPETYPNVDETRTYSIDQWKALGVDVVIPPQEDGHLN
jgi:hypothetical protein